MCLEVGKDFLAMTLKAQSIKEQIKKLDFTEVKTTCSFEETIKRMKKKSCTLGENIPQTIYLSKHLYLSNTSQKILKTQQQK